MKDPFFYEPDRTLTLLARTSAPPATESTLTAWAVLALLLVLAALVIGGG